MNLSWCQKSWIERKAASLVADVDVPEPVPWNEKRAVPVQFFALKKERFPPEAWG
jgi:hypothetical protein